MLQRRFFYIEYNKVQLYLITSCRGYKYIGKEQYAGSENHTPHELRKRESPWNDRVPKSSFSIATDQKALPEKLGPTNYTKEEGTRGETKELGF